MVGLYGLNGSFRAKEGSGDALAGLLQDAAALLEKNHDCLVYIVGQSAGDNDLVLVNEIWTSREAHDASLQDERVKELIQRAMPLIAEMAGSSEFTPAGGKGLRTS